MFAFLSGWMMYQTVFLSLVNDQMSEKEREKVINQEISKIQEQRIMRMGNTPYRYAHSITETNTTISFTKTIPMFV